MGEHKPPILLVDVVRLCGPDDLPSVDELAAELRPICTHGIGVCNRRTEADHLVLEDDPYASSILPSAQLSSKTHNQVIRRLLPQIRRERREPAHTAALDEPRIVHVVHVAAVSISGLIACT